MGKIRVKVVGEEETSKKKKTYEERKADKAQNALEETLESQAESAPVKAADVQSETPPEDTTQQTIQEAKPAAATEKSSEKKTNGVKKLTKHIPSKKYTGNAQIIDKSKTYSLNEAVDVLKKLKGSKFDETVELHMNVKEEGLSGTLSLPHGTGKEIRIKVADDALIAEIEKGKVDFDVLIASPSFMPQLAKVAKILGPKGLMPNPKNGTITDDPKPLIEKLSKGQIRFKTEAKAPIIHLSVGKVSFDADKLQENIKTVLNAVGTGKISKVTLKSTMSPGIKISI